MIQQVFNIALFSCLSRIMLNDVPHALFPEGKDSSVREEKLKRTIILSDAKWFLDAGFINPDTYTRVLRWLNGSVDPEIQLTVVSWLERDLKWFAELVPPLLSYFWYLYPATKVGFKALSEMLARWIAELKRV